MDDWPVLYKQGGYGGAGSGTGSLLENNRLLIKWLSCFIEKHTLKSILDIPCGDMQWIPELLKGTPIDYYLGIDYVNFIVERNKISFPNLDFRCGDVLDPCFSLERDFDLLICKDIVQHCTPTELTSLLLNLKNVKARFKLMIIPWNSYLPGKTPIHEYQSDFVKKIYSL